MFLFSDSYDSCLEASLRPYQVWFDSGHGRSRLGEWQKQALEILTTTKYSSYTFSFNPGNFED